MMLSLRHLSLLAVLCAVSTGCGDPRPDPAGEQTQSSEAARVAAIAEQHAAEGRRRARLQSAAYRSQDPQLGIHWRTDFKAALAEARRSKRPLFIAFHALRRGEAGAPHC